MIQQAIHEVIEGQNLSFEAAREVMNEIMSGETTPAQMAAFLTGFISLPAENFCLLRMMNTIVQMEEKGLSSEQAQIEAFYANSKG